MNREDETKIGYIQDKVDAISESVHKIDIGLAVTQQTLKNHTKHDEVLDAHILEKLQNIDITLGKQHVSLIEHMSRSASNEKAIGLIVKELKPIINQYVIINFIAKFAGLVLGSTFLYELIKLVFRR